MKKKILFFSCALALTLTHVKAQKADTLRAKATYAFTHIENTNEPDKPIQEQMVLLLGSNASAYISLDKALADEKRKKDLEEQIKNSSPGNMRLNLSSGFKRHISDEIYQYANEKKLITKKRLVNDYLIEEELPQINWNISGETSVISGLNCQKATARVKGRDYTAWFCPDLPFQSGPWKLNGLPGLIVEAYDTKKEVVFKFEGFEEVKNVPVDSKDASKEEMLGGILSFSGLSSSDLLNSQTISLPKKAIKTTQKEYEKLADAMKKDPAGFINSSMAGTGNNIKVETRVSPTATVTKITANNPIELPEKK